MSTERGVSAEPAPTTGPRDVVVVCPTEYGGQLEHAADLALALCADEGVATVQLVSRPGAGDYLGWGEDHPVRVVETVPPRRTRVPGSAAGKVLRAGLQVWDLVREHLAVRAAAGRVGRTAVLALDSTKYPLPGVLRAHRDQRTAVFVHNAQPHFDLDSASPRERFLLWLDRSCARHADRVVTHGAEQAQIVRGCTSRPVAAVDLPVSSRLDPEPAQSAKLPAEPFALCIGEMRANKGIELAIRAAGDAGVPLLVRGAAETPELGRELTRLAAGHPSVDLQDRFLSREEFAALVQQAAVIVLPYTHFDAHSGVLAKAVGAGTPVVASDLPSLRAQARGYDRFTAADVRDTRAFGATLRAVYDDAATPRRDRRAVSGRDHADWQPTVAAVLGTWTS